MPQEADAEIGQRLFSSGVLDEFERAVATDDSMVVVMLLEDVGVDTETIGRMLLQLDKAYLLALVEAGHAAAAAAR